MGYVSFVPGIGLGSGRRIGRGAFLNRCLKTKLGILVALYRITSAILVRYNMYSIVVLPISIFIFLF